MAGALLVLGLLQAAGGLLRPPALARPELPSPGVPATTAAPAGAYVELLAAPGLWAVVQWQDMAGDWHDVEGWQGAADADGLLRWWVEAGDFGGRPFRWAAYEGPDGPPACASAAFHLPAGPGESLRVTCE
jgi:hypothetical protein